MAMGTRRRGGTWSRPGRCELRWLAVVAFLAVLLGSPATAQQPSYRTLDPELFPIPETLVPAVEFWRAVFSRYSSDQSVIHDDRRLDVVYEVVESTDLQQDGRSEGTVQRLRERRVRAEIERVQGVLRSLAGDRTVDVDDAEKERFRALLDGLPDGSPQFRAAKGRVRAQAGLKDHFANAIEVSGWFMPGIERALERAGVPTEIKCLPFVESMFNYTARSRVGASGAWQFTRATGGRYLQIDSAVDARADVLLAADGAARMLADNYRRVKSWPLALTGYNHGIGGMERAARSLGTRDIGTIVERYSSSTFGFASRNFYVEFIAAVSVYQERETLFPGVEARPELRFDAFPPTKFVSLIDLSLLTEVELAALEKLNPALHPDVVRGNLLVPAGYPLRVPEGRLAAFSAAFDRLPNDRRRDRQLATRYRVEKGDTLGSIARRFGTSVASVQRANGLPRADRIYVGQVLEISSRGGTLPPLDLAPLVATTAGGFGSGIARGIDRSASAHTVRAGESLSVIAARYGVGVSELAAANALASPDLLPVGRTLAIPRPGSGPTARAESMRTHIVRAGESLHRIASAYDTTVQAIVSLNGLTSTLIRVGQTLSIPVAR